MPSGPRRAGSRALLPAADANEAAADEPLCTAGCRGAPASSSTCRAELARRKTDLTDPVADAEALERVLDEIEQMAERRRAFDAAGHPVPPAIINGVAVEDDRSPAEKIADALIEGGWKAAARELAAYLESRSL